MSNTHDIPHPPDDLLGHTVWLRQQPNGYRAGMDAAVLAATVRAGTGERVLELGCGAGAVLLQAAARRPEARLDGLEREADALALAQSNIALNGIADRVEALAGDVADGFRALGRERYDWVIANPPFFDDPAALRAPAPAKRAAWMADDGLGAWTGFMLAACRDGGRMLLIHRADRLAAILSGLSDKAGSFAILPIQPFADTPAKRVLVQAVRGGKAPLRLLPPLILHERGRDGHSADAEALLGGQAHLDLSTTGPTVRPGL